ncbi:MAG: glycosyltransferase family 4 protein [Myxococcota bacterium]
MEAPTNAAAPEPVAIVVSRFPSVTETFILREIEELERQGVPVVLVPLLREPLDSAQGSTVHPEARAWVERALYAPYLSGAIARANLRALLVRPRGYLGTLTGLLWDMRRNPGFALRTLALYPKCVWNARRLRALGVRHVHAHFATHPLTAAYVMSSLEDELSFSVTVHAHDIFASHAGLRRKLAAARFVRCISDFNRRYLEAHFGSGRPRLDPRRLKVIHCGIEPERYARGASGEGPSRHRPARLLSIAAMRAYKGLRHLIEAIALLRERGIALRCEVIGEGHLRADLEAQIARAGLEGEVRLLGAQTQEQVSAALGHCDLFVLPSVLDREGRGEPGRVDADGYMEGIPVALMEAMASGVPVVATQISGVPELVQDGETGFLVPPAHASALAEAIEAALSDPARARRLALAGKERVRREFRLAACVAALRRELTGGAC